MLSVQLPQSLQPWPGEWIFLPSTRRRQRCAAAVRLQSCSRRDDARWSRQPRPWPVRNLASSPKSSRPPAEPAGRGSRVGRLLLRRPEAGALNYLQLVRHLTVTDSDKPLLQLQGSELLAQKPGFQVMLKICLRPSQQPSLPCLFLKPSRGQLGLPSASSFVSFDLLRPGPGLQVAAALPRSPCAGPEHFPISFTTSSWGRFLHD